jgi:PST family polysaccharide transporter
MLGGLLYLAAPWIAEFFHDSRLLQVVPVLSWVFIIGGLGIQHEALMRRQMRYRSLVLTEVSGLLLASILVVALALEGWGYWAMVWMQVAAIVVRIALLWILSGWRPSHPVFKVGVRKMTVFGGSLTLANVVQYLSRQSDQLMLGSSSGAHVLGLYSTAMQMLMLPIQQVLAPLAPVAQLALSRTHLNPQDFRRVYGLLLMLVGYASMPLMAVLAVLAEPVVHVFLGENWLEVVPIVRTLAATGWILAVNNTMGWVFIARGQGGRMLRWNMVMAPLLILGFAAGVPWGGEGVAWGFFTVIYLTRLIHFRYTLHGSGVSLLDMWLILRWPMTLSMVLAAAAGLVIYIGANLEAWQVLLYASLLIVMLLFGIVRGFAPIRQHMREVVLLLQEARA